MMDEASMQGHTGDEWQKLYKETFFASPKGRPGLEALAEEYEDRCRALVSALFFGKKCPPWDWAPENQDPRTDEERREDRSRNIERAWQWMRGGIRIVD